MTTPLRSTYIDHHNILCWITSLDSHRVFIPSPWSVIRLCFSLFTYICLSHSGAVGDKQSGISGVLCVANETLGHGHWTHFRTKLCLNNFLYNTPQLLYLVWTDQLTIEQHTKFETYLHIFIYLLSCMLYTIRCINIQGCLKPIPYSCFTHLVCR